MLAISCFVVVLSFSPIFGNYCSGPLLSNRITGSLNCPTHSRPKHCKADSVREKSGMTCEHLRSFEIFDIDPQLYGEGPSVQMIPMAHHYYYARMNEGFGSCCPTCLEEISNMTLTLTWTGNPSAQAWDTGYGLRAFRRDCSSVPSCNCICVGEQGTIGTNGGSIGTYRYIPILTNDATPGAGKWALFGHCWDVNKIGDSINSLVSWNVFSLTKTLTSADKLKIITRLAQIGFRINKSTLIEIKFP